MELVIKLDFDNIKQNSLRYYIFFNIRRGRMAVVFCNVTLDGKTKEQNLNGVAKLIAKLCIHWRLPQTLVMLWIVYKLY